MPIPLPSAVEGVLHEGRQAHLAISAADGPHATPELYAWSGGALWCAVARTTLKARVLAKDPSAAAVVAVPGRAVLLAGRAELHDPRSVSGVVRQLLELPRSAPAVARYVVRNVGDLVAFAGDLATGRLGRRPPPLRLLVRLQPDRVARIDGGELVEGWGRWSDLRSPGPEPVPAGGEAVVAALPGPVAVPGRWFEEDGVLHVPTGTRALADLSRRFPIGVVRDEYVAPGPAAKQGTLLRGTGRLEGQDRILVDVERVVTWDGVETGTHPAT